MPSCDRPTQGFSGASARQHSAHPPRHAPSSQAAINGFMLLPADSRQGGDVTRSLRTDEADLVRVIRTSTDFAYFAMPTKKMVSRFRFMIPFVENG